MEPRLFPKEPTFSPKVITCWWRYRCRTSQGSARSSIWVRGRTMYIIIAGGGKVGSYLAHLLVGKGHDVAVIEQSAEACEALSDWGKAVSYTHLRAHETRHDLVCRLLLEKKKKNKKKKK